MIQFLVVIGFAAITSANPLLRLQGKIVGGESINITEAPYQISLFTQGRFLCGGSIISENYILTAAHCSVYSDYTVRAGSTYRVEGGSEHRVIDVIPHKNFGRNAYGFPINDIALMKVDPPFQMDKARKAVQLAKKDSFFSPGLHAKVSGWGSTSEGGYGSPHLLAVQIPLISKESCQAMYDDFGELPDGQICAAQSEGGKDSCQGDSGGPMVVEGNLAGVVSWGNGCGRPSFPGVYTEVAYHRDWIETNSGI